MQNLFAIGEIVITQGMFMASDNGQEVTVIGAPEMDHAISFYTGRRTTTEKRWMYPVKWAGGEETWEPYWMLRKRHQPPEDVDVERQLEAAKP